MAIDPEVKEGKTRFRLKLKTRSGGHHVFIWGETAFDALATFVNAVALEQDTLDPDKLGFQPPLEIELTEEPE